jgi:hypothetical protein
MLLDGMSATEDDDEMMEVELYKNEHEWLGDVYYHGKRAKPVDLNKVQTREREKTVFGLLFG